MSGPGFVDGVPVEQAITDAIGKHLAPARANKAFMERLGRRIEEDKPILDRLEAMEHAEQNAVVDAAMTEIRRLASHEHRYPKPNDQGFPVNQCLDCGRWRDG